MDLLESQNKATGEAEMEAEKKNKVESEKEDLPISKGSEDNGRAATLPMPPTGQQLVIFYNGSVSVYDAVTPEKAQAIMLIAAAAAAVSAASANKAPMAVGPNVADGGVGTATASATAALTRSLSQQSSSCAIAVAGSPPRPQVLASHSASSLCKLQADLPIARRHSLQQFLEKRRNRLVNKAPYAPAKKPDEGMDVGVEGKPQLS